MKEFRSLIITPVPAAVGKQAAQLPGVLYIATFQALVVPSYVVVAMTQVEETTILSDADLALYAACFEYFGSAKVTIPLTVKVAIAEEASEPQFHLPLAAIAQRLGALKRYLVMAVQRVFSKPGTQVLSTDSKTTLMLGESGTPVTGKASTNFYR